MTCPHLCTSCSESFAGFELALKNQSRCNVRLPAAFLFNLLLITNMVEYVASGSLNSYTDIYCYRRP